MAHSLPSSERRSLSLVPRTKRSGDALSLRFPMSGSWLNVGRISMVDVAVDVSHSSGLPTVSGAD